MPTHSGGLLGSRYCGEILSRPFGRIRLQHALVGEHRKARCRDADDDVGLRIRLLGEELRGDDAGRIAHPLDVDVRIGLLEAFLVGLDLVGFERGVDEQLGLLRDGGTRREQAERGTASEARTLRIATSCQGCGSCARSFVVGCVETGFGLIDRSRGRRRGAGHPTPATRCRQPTHTPREQGAERSACDEHGGYG